MSELNRERKRLRITHDGRYAHTLKVIDIETGRCLPANSVDFHADMDGMPTATVRVLFSEVDVETDATVITYCPGCNREVEPKAAKPTSAPIPFNANEYVRLRLTDIGRAIYWVHTGGRSEPETDADGYSRFQLWQAMMIFGPYVGMGRDEPFEMNVMLEPGR